jgi:diguanylate cyclase (GGDEF)-like protein
VVDTEHSHTGAGGGNDDPGGVQRFLLVVYGAELGRRHDLSCPEVSIGRSTGCDILVDQAGVSRKHATVLVGEHGVQIRDEGSRNGTFVDNRRIEEVDLRDGDQVRIGGTIFKFIEAADADEIYNDELYRLSSVDGLTQVSNRRSLEEAAGRAMESAKSGGEPVAIVVLDVEGMTSLNETYGTSTGDGILRELAGRLRAHVRGVDVVARVGSDMFAVLLPGRCIDDARAVVGELSRVVMRTPFEVGGREIDVEVSFGWAESGPRASSFEGLLDRAKRVLNEARRVRVTGALE